MYIYTCHAKVTFISCMILSLFFMLCPSTYAYSTHLDRNSPTRDSIHTMHSILGVLISMRPSFRISVKKKLVRKNDCKSVCSEIKSSMSPFVVT